MPLSVSAATTAVPPTGPDVWSVVSVLIGGLLSLYASVVCSRYQRYGALLREVARERQNYEGHPVDENDLAHSVPKAIEFWRLVERTEWSLNADGHHSAATEMNKLKGFAYQAAIDSQNLLARRSKGVAIGHELLAFQIKLRNDKTSWAQFELKLHPSWWAIVQPWPHPPMPTKVIA